MGEWREARLRDVCTGIFDCPHSTPALTASGPCVVRTQDIRSGTFRADEAGHVSEATYQERIARAEPSPGDILFSREGTYFGVAAEVPKGVRVCLGQRMVLIRPDQSVADARFVRYWLNSPAMVAHIRGYRDGSVAERLNLPTIRDLPIALPPLIEQRRMAGILGALDDKIELNRRMSETLQATARALFKSWFAAEAGMEADGWHSCTIGDLAEVVGGSTPSTAEPRFWNGSHYWATPKDLAGLRTPILLRTERMLTDAGIGQISSGLLPAGTVLMSSRAPIGYLAITEVPVAVNQGFIAMKPRPGVSALFLLHWAASSQAEILSRANGSTFLEISKSSFRPIEVYAPPADAMASFDRFVRPIHERVVANERQIDVLAKMRDALLPRLLSGETSLPRAAGS
jgi:type I restriction enzyme S subunit